MLGIIPFCMHNSVVHFLDTNVIGETMFIAKTDYRYTYVKYRLRLEVLVSSFYLRSPVCDLKFFLSFFFRRTRDHARHKPSQIKMVYANLYAGFWYEICLMKVCGKL